MGITEEATIDCAAAYPQAFDATHRALVELGASISHADPATGTIQASKSMGMATWGENLTVQVGAVTETQSRVTVKSSLKFGLVDWGKNKKNLAALEESLQRKLTGGHGAAPAPPAPQGAWHADPSGRHEHRWFDGQQWTESVADAGVTATDPL